ncbi:MAG: peptide deformylase [Patescibacteria group bacterium]
MNEDKRIVQSDHPMLRKYAERIPVKDINSPYIKKLIDDMKAILATQKDGIAIAAPQINENLRMFVVSDAILKEADKEYKSIGKDIVFINPEIVKISKKKHEVEEGCLSIRWKYGKVYRPVKITIKGYNEDGKKIERGASGLLAQVFQHEIDHLEGILFTDKARDVHDIPPDKLEK